MKTSVVIGAGFGDEGKGLMTDYLVAQGDHQNTIVVRFNGGAQAGHTVQRGDLKHVFGHFGSGTLLGAKTYLSKFFVVNPILFHKEHEQLKLLLNGNVPKIIIDGMCKITTPYDMISNQIEELFRDKLRHGSCGVGFGETLERDKVHPYSTLRAWDMHIPHQMNFHLEMARQYYKTKWANLNSETTSADILSLVALFDNYLVFDSFMENLAYVCNNSEVHIDSREFLNLKSTDESDLVFEGAQGLMLDMDHGSFPHVTRSNTGLFNVGELMKNNYRPMDVYYMSRAYKTRHGAGPMSNEEPMPSWVNDPTNAPNEWQGTLRYAPLNLDELLMVIMRDKNHARNNIPNVKNIGVCVTCLDQLPNGEATYILNNTKIKGKIVDIISLTDAMYTSYGPTAKDIVRIR